MAPGETPGKRKGRAVLAAGLLLVLAASAAVRLAYLREHAAEPDFSSPGVDAAYHDYWARGLATGDWTPPPDREDPLLRSTPYLRPPGTPFFLAAVYRLLGPGYAGPRVVQSLLGLASVLLGFSLARKRFGDATALVHGALLGGYWSFVYFEGELLEPPLLVFLGLLLLLLLDRWEDGLTRGRAAAAGALLGLALLVRPTVLLFGLAVPAWSAGSGDRSRLGTAPWLLRMALFAAAAAAVVAPAVGRNLVVSGEPVLVAGGGIAFYMGNREGGSGRVASELPGGGEFRHCFDYRGVVRRLSREAGRPLAHGEVSARYRELALRFLRERPGEALALAGRKALLLLGPLEVGHNREDEVVREHSPVLRSLPGGFPAALALALLGTLLFRRDGSVPEGAPGERRSRRRLLALAWLWFLCGVAAHVPFVVAGRYRVPLVPALLLPAAYALVALAGDLRARRFGPAALAAAAGALLLLALSRNWAGYAPEPWKWRFERGLALSRGGDLTGAEREYGEALRLRPSFVPAKVNLALRRMEGGDLASAERLLREAAREAPGDGSIRYDLGVVLGKAGRAGEARGELEAALALEPEGLPVLDALASLARGRGDAVAAARYLGEAARLRGDRALLLSLAGEMERLGHRGEADRLYRAAVALPPP